MRSHFYLPLLALSLGACSAQDIKLMNDSLRNSSYYQRSTYNQPYNYIYPDEPKRSSRKTVKPTRTNTQKYERICRDFNRQIMECPTPETM